MKTVIVKTQAEFDALPAKFDEYTIVEIRSDANIWITVNKCPDSSRVVARDSSRVVARESSSVVAWDSSSVEASESSSVVAWDSSSVVAHDISFVAIFASAVAVKALYDYAIASFNGCTPKVEFADGKTQVIERPCSVMHTFDEMLERGYVEADGICKKLVSRKTIGDVTVFTVRGHVDREDSFVARKGDKFAHGETVEKAIEDLRYKITDRDTERFKAWKKTDTKPLDELIEAYRVITGACEFGVKEFMARAKVNKEAFTVSEAIKLTKGEFGSEAFSEFFA